MRARQTANLRLGTGEKSEIGATEGESRAKGLSFANEDVGAPLSGGLKHTGGDRVGAHDEQRLMFDARALAVVRSSRTPR